MKNGGSTFFGVAGYAFKNAEVEADVLAYMAAAAAGMPTPVHIEERLKRHVSVFSGMDESTYDSTGYKDYDQIIFTNAKQLASNIVGEYTMNQLYRSWSNMPEGRERIGKLMAKALSKHFGCADFDIDTSYAEYTRLSSVDPASKKIHLELKEEIISGGDFKKLFSHAVHELAHARQIIKLNEEIDKYKAGAFKIESEADLWNILEAINADADFYLSPDKGATKEEYLWQLCEIEANSMEAYVTAIAYDVLEDMNKGRAKTGITP